MLGSDQNITATALGLSDHTNSYSRTLTMVHYHCVWWCHQLTHRQNTNHCVNNIQWLKNLHDVASTGYKNLCTFCSLTFWQLHKLRSSHIKVFNTTGTGRMRMQLAKVVIASLLVLAVCAQGLPEGNECVLRCENSSYVVSYTKVVCSVIG